MTNFVDKVLALLEGNDEKGIAIKNERLARAAFEQQLATLEGAKIDAETKVDEALDNYESKVFPIKVIEDRSSYMFNIKNAKENLDEAEQDLDDVIDSIKFWKFEMKKAFDNKEKKPILKGKD